MLLKSCFFNFRRFLGSRCCSLFSRRIFLILVHKDDKFFCTCSQGVKSCSWKSIVLLKSAEENMLHLRWSSTHWRKEKLQQSFRMHTPPSACFACFRRGVHPSALLQFLFSSVCSCPTFECSNFSSFLFSKKVTFHVLTQYIWYIAEHKESLAHWWSISQSNESS